MKTTQSANRHGAIRQFLDVCRKAFFQTVLTGLLLSGLASSFAGDTPPPAPTANDGTAEEMLKKPYYLTGDWFGLRPTLEQRGVTFDLFEIFDVYGNVSGGEHQALEYFSRTRFTMDIDLNKLVGWQGAELYTSAVTQQGERFAKSKIDVYTNPSSIEGTQTTRLAEIWLQQKLFGDKVAIKIGKIDGVAEFGLQEIGSTFMNDELNYVTNQTFTAGMPFDPPGKPGAVISIKPLEGPILSGFYAKTGVFAGNDDNAYFEDATGTSFAIRSPAVLGAEIGWRTPEKSDLLPGVYKVGMHYNFGDTPRFDGTVASSNYFIYGNASQTLRYFDAEKTRHIDAGFTLSGAPGDRNANYFEATAILRVIGSCATRPKDEVGLGFIVSNFSHEFSDQSLSQGGPDLGGSEKTVELTYKIQVNRWFVLQPDAQVVFDPQGNSNRGAVGILGLRTFVIF
jgi:porin